MSKRNSVIVECHNNCLRNTGVRCTFWGISHKALYKEKEDEKLNYIQFMEHDKCSFYKSKKKNENKILVLPRDYGCIPKTGGANIRAS